MMNKTWNYFKICKSQLTLDLVLPSGQSFRWKKNKQEEWIGVFASKVWRLKQTDDAVFYKVYTAATSESNSNLSMKTEVAEIIGDSMKSEDKESIGEVIKKDPSDKLKRTRSGRTLKSCKKSKLDIKEDSSNILSNKNRNQTTDKESELKEISSIKAESIEIVKKENDTEKNHIEILCDKEDHKSLNTSTDSNYSLLKDYFQLDVDLESLYRTWSENDSHFEKVAASFRGIRILRQDPMENLMSFVCSTNNHISRISSMVEKLCKHYGAFITSVDGEDYYSFPSFADLACEGLESNLRQLGFGYRAKYIAGIVKYVMETKKKGWLESLRYLPYEETKSELTKLLGVGAKVADCVCLMSMDKSEAVPIDTHVWQFTCKHYMPKLQYSKSLTDKLYLEIGKFYRELWGTYAGWAQAVLFAADLKQHQALASSETGTKKYKKK